MTMCPEQGGARRWRAAPSAEGAGRWQGGAGAALGVIWKGLRWEQWADPSDSPSGEEGVRSHHGRPITPSLLGLHPHRILRLVESYFPRSSLEHQAMSRDLTSRDVSRGLVLHPGDPQASQQESQGCSLQRRPRQPCPLPPDGCGPPAPAAATPPGPPCRSVNSGQRACRASHGNPSHSLWGPDCLGPAASWWTWHRPQRDHMPILLGLPGLVTNPAG